MINGFGEDVIAVYRRDARDAADCPGWTQMECIVGETAEERIAEYHRMGMMILASYPNGETVDITEAEIKRVYAKPYKIILRSPLDIEIFSFATRESANDFVSEVLEEFKGFKRA